MSSSTLSPAVLLFRALVMTSVGAGLLGGPLDLWMPQLIPESIRAAFAELPQPTVEYAVSVSLLNFFILGINLAAAAGLFMFKPWARGFAVLVTVLTLLVYPLYGAQVRSTWSSLLLDASTTLWGAALAISYVSSLSYRFSFEHVERPDDLG
jgi:hypothetical protein